MNVSPIDVEAFLASIKDHPNVELVAYLREGLTTGFAVGAVAYDDTVPRHQNNRLSAAQFTARVYKWFAEECSAGRVAGPFPEPPHPRLQVIPLGVTGKKGHSREEKGRVYADLSSSWDDGALSLNASTVDDDCSLQYTSVVDAVRVAQQYVDEGGQPCGTLADILHAFRNLMVRAVDLHLLGMAFPDEHTGAMQYYYDRCISFGGARYPKIWDSLASAVQWALQRRLDDAEIRARVAHLCDDWIGIGLDLLQCQAAEEIMTNYFREIGLPEAVDKHVAACRLFEYLGLMVDLARRRVGIPLNKRTDLCARLRKFATTSPTPTKEAESLLGKLGFADPVIPAARPRVSAIYAVTMPAVRGGRRWVTPDDDAREACSWLASLIEADPWISFDALVVTPASCTLTFAVDAAGDDGMGGFCLGDSPRWFHATWPPRWREGSSTLKELRAATTAVAVGAVIADSASEVTQVLVHTDSKALVGAVRKGRSSSAPLNAAVADLLALCVSKGVVLVVSWHRRDTSLSALAADALSHGNLQAAARFVPQLSGASRMEVPSIVLAL